MSVVVTGAAGFVGRTLVATLRDTGHDVVAVDRESPVGSERPGGLVELRADLLDGDGRVDAALREAAAVFHLAGCPGVRDAATDTPWRRHRDNVLTAAYVLGRVPPTTPLVVTSSSSVYGGSVYGGSPGRPCVETDAVRPLGGYAESKVRVEQLCAQRLATGGVVSIARPFTVAGEGQRADMALARWIAAARLGQPLRVLGSLDRTRDVTDVRDVAAALVALAGSAARGPVNIGTGTGYTLGELVAAVAAALDADVRTHVVPASPAEAHHTLADPGLLRRLVGWSPITDLRALVQRQAAHAAPVLLEAAS